MPGSVILLPSGGDHERAAFLALLGRAGLRLVDIDLPIADPAPFATRVCAAIHLARPASPLLIVAPTASAGHLASIALAQRRAHRQVGGYVLIDPGQDAANAPGGADWPDAPVTCIAYREPAPAWVRLRDWASVSCPSLAEVVSTTMALAVNLA
jgi:hypothetical protein